MVVISFCRSQNVSLDGEKSPEWVPAAVLLVVLFQKAPEYLPAQSFKPDIINILH